jgi:hypothetical protein
MACAGLLLVGLMAAVSTNVPDPVRLPDPDPVRAPNAVHLNTWLNSPPPVAHTMPAGPINLSVHGAIHAPAFSPSESGIAPGAPQNDRWGGGSRTSISLGPLHTEFGGVTDRHMHLATVKLEGVSVFGGSIGGSIDSRSARITFSWHTSP